MQMTESEIVISYKAAKQKRRQIGILAELNCCKPNDIAKILEKNGVEVGIVGRPKKEQMVEQAPEEPVTPAVEEKAESKEETEQITEETTESVSCDIDVPAGYYQPGSYEYSRVGLPVCVRNVLIDKMKELSREMTDLRVEMDKKEKAFYEINDFLEMVNKGLYREEEPCK